VACYHQLPFYIHIFMFEDPNPYQDTSAFKVWLHIQTWLIESSRN